MSIQVTDQLSKQALDQFSTSQQVRWRRRILRGLAIAACSYALLWLTGTLLMLALSLLARTQVDHAVDTPQITGIANFRNVDDRLFRGGNPDQDGLEQLADLDIRTIVDLRPHPPSPAETDYIDRFGMRLVHIPMTDGHAPQAEDVDQFMNVMETTRGPVFVHCGAGVGRSGSLTAAYLVETGQASAWQAAGHSLAVGPTSLEQLDYMLDLDPGSHEKPPWPITLLSRLVDAPRVQLGKLI